MAWAPADTNLPALQGLVDRAEVRWDGRPPRGRSPGGRLLGPSEGEPWLWVGPHMGVATGEFGPERRSCVWAHAVKGGLRVALAPVEGEALLQGEVALLDVPREGSPVTFRVSATPPGSSADAASGPEARVVLTDSREGSRWRPFEVRLTGGGALIEITTARPDWRQVCFTLALTKASAP